MPASEIPRIARVSGRLTSGTLRHCAAPPDDRECVVTKVRAAPSREARALDVANEEENPMRAAGVFRTLVVTAALMLAIGVAACADDDASAPGELPSAEPAVPSERGEWPAEAPKAAAEEIPGFEAGPPAEPAKESPDESGPPAAEPEEDEEEAPEADRE